MTEHPLIAQCRRTMEWDTLRQLIEAYDWPYWHYYGYDCSDEARMRGNAQRAVIEQQVHKMLAEGIATCDQIRVQWAKYARATGFGFSITKDFDGRVQRIAADLNAAQTKEN